MKMNQSMLYMRYLSLVVLLLVSFVSFGQAPSNYVNINGRYRWIAGMFDSTFHIPKGTTPSLRTGGSTNGGALFYKTADSSLQLYTGTQWLRMLKVGDTTGMLTPYFNSVGVGLKNTGQTVYADTLLLSTRLWRNKGIDSVQANLTAGLATKLNISDTASMLSPYARTVNVRQIVSDSLGGLVRLKALNAGGAALYTNSGTKVAEWGLGGSANMDFHGFAGYDINRASSYTVRSFTDKNYVDSAISASPSGTVTSIATNTGTGITGGTITTSGTIAADTLLLSTRAWRQKGVDSVAALANTKVSSVSGTSPISSSGGTSPTISISQSSGSTNGFLSSTDWNTFNNKQNALTLTTTGTSGAATLVGSTLNIPQYQAALTNPVTGTGTTNYIPKFTSSSAIGNSQIFDNGTSIGIGTTSTNANEKLRVDGGRLVVLGGSDVYQLKLAYNNATAGFWLGSPSANALAFYNDAGTERMRLDASGNLLVGGTSADRKLVVTDASTTGTGVIQGIRLVGNAGNYYDIGRVSATGEFTISGNQAGTPLFTLVQNSAERLRVDASGNLGINTSSPSYKLDVSGDLRTTQTAIIGNGASQTEISINSLGGNNQGPFVRFQKAGAAKGYIGTYSAIISGTSDDLTYYATGAQQWMTNNSATTKMTLDASGNLGLGVTPSAWGSAARGFQVGAYGSISGFTNELDISSNSYWNAGYKYINTNPATLYTQYNGQHQWFNAPSGTAGNAISFTQAMTLFSTGNLAVGGTSDNGSRLNVTGAGTFSSSVTATIFDATSSAYRFNGNNALSLVSLGGQNVVKINAAGFWGTQLVGANDQGILINNTGQVGIGTTSPTYKLDIYGGASGTRTDVFVANAAANYNIGVLSDNNGFASTTNAMLFYTAATERMRITSGGNVGIGSSSPLSATGYTALTINNATNGGILDLQQNGTSVARLGNNGTTVAFLETRTATPLTISTNDTERMRITSGGLVGIGTSAPATALGVQFADATTTQSQFQGIAIANSNTTINNGSAITFSHSAASINSFAKIGAIYTDRSGGSEDIDLFFGTLGAGSYAERMRITSGGNVGIGTSSPNANDLLSVVGNSSLINTSYKSSPRAAGYMYWRSGGDATERNVAVASIAGWDEYNGGQFNGSLKFYTQTSNSLTEKMQLTSSGELLINTTSDAGDYKLQVNGAGYFGGVNVPIYLSSNNLNGTILQLFNNYSTSHTWGLNAYTNGNLYFQYGATNPAFLSSTGNLELSGSIKTAAPSGGNAAAWKLGERVASSGVTFNDQQYIQLDIGGTLYYLATVDLPMPEAYPQATSGPSNNYKMAPVQVKTTRDAEIEKLRKEIEELKQLIKNK